MKSWGRHDVLVQTGASGLGVGGVGGGPMGLLRGLRLVRRNFT